jgi:pimeloyl-ACP methyl ester carboxylesterase
MRTLVIVHGAFGGGWEWTAVAELLRAEGMRVFTPTLAGLGDRARDGAGTVGLGTHVADIIAALDMEDLHDVVLCAASYGGVPVTAAAAQVAHRLARIVYPDALVPRDRGCCGSPSRPVRRGVPGRAAAGWARPPGSCPGSHPSSRRQRPRGRPAQVRGPAAAATCAHLHRDGRGGADDREDHVRAKHRVESGSGSGRPDHRDGAAGTTGWLGLSGDRGDA